MDFKDGDWIIATQCRRLFNGGMDCSWQDMPIYIVGVTETHIVYRTQYGDLHHSMLKVHLAEYGFVLADPLLIKMALQRSAFEDLRVMNDFNEWNW